MQMASAAACKEAAGTHLQAKFNSSILSCIQQFNSHDMAGATPCLIVLREQAPLYLQRDHVLTRYLHGAWQLHVWPLTDRNDTLS